MSLHDIVTSMRWASVPISGKERVMPRLVWFFALLSTATLGCETSCPQSPTACASYSQIRLDAGATLTTSTELAAYRITLGFSTKEAGGPSNVSSPDTGDLDGIQTCVFTTPFQPHQIFACDPVGPFVATIDYQGHSGCDVTPGEPVGVECNSSVTADRVLRVTGAVTHVRLTLEKDTQSFPSVDVTIAEKAVHPDGPSCPAVCSQGSTTVSLSDILASGSPMP